MFFRAVQPFQSRNSTAPFGFASTMPTLSREAASAAGPGLPADDCLLKHKGPGNWSPWLGNWRLAENLRFPVLSWGGLLRDLIRMHAVERPALLSLLLYIGLRWWGAFQRPYWICLWRFKAFKSKIPLIWKVRRGQRRHYRFNFQFEVTS